MICFFKQKTAYELRISDWSSDVCFSDLWAKIAEDAGYQVTLLDDNNMTAVKQRLGVPAELASCHTAVVGDYVIEGHVPRSAERRVGKECECTCTSRRSTSH